MAVVDLDQAHFASIIAGVSVRRGLSPRAASIALATAYQETGIRNLTYGDRDSVGLFQQRPSQGWGTKQQLMDPSYAAGRFYDALVKIKNWETDDINNVAQKVQRSGYPEAYNDHEADARVLASALTGQSPAGFSCLDRTGAAGDVKELRRSLQRTFGNLDDSADGSVITIRARGDRRAWAYAHYAVANASLYGVTTVKSARSPRVVAAVVAASSRSAMPVGVESSSWYCSRVSRGSTSTRLSTRRTRGSAARRRE